MSVKFCVIKHLTKIGLGQINYRAKLRRNWKLWIRIIKKEVIVENYNHL
jgi:hypothetical protein